MIRKGDDGATHRTRSRLAPVVIVCAVVALLALALFLALRGLSSEGSRISLSLYDSNGKGKITAQVQYACGDDPCGNEGDRLFYEVEGGGVESPASARVGSTEIKEAVIREQGNGLLVYYGIPAGEPGYSLIDFACSSIGDEITVKATVETDSGAEKSSSTGTVTCPSK